MAPYIQIFEVAWDCSEMLLFILVYFNRSLGSRVWEWGPGTKADILRGEESRRKR